MKRTGGARTDEILGQDSGPEGLPHSIIVTPDGTEGEAPAAPGAGPGDAALPEESRPEPEQPARPRRKGAAGTARPARAGAAEKR
jgi:DNA topoisomerase-6 subunit B